MLAVAPGRRLRPDPRSVAARPSPPRTHGASVLLVHGFGSTKSSWSLLARNLSARGVTVDAITYAPFGTSVEQLAVEVDRLLCQTGADKVHLVGHSLGGVVIAQAIASGRLTGQIDTVLTFGGSPWAHLLPFGAIVRELRKGSPLLRRLAAAPAPDGMRWLAFTATLDVIVPGLRSVRTHAHVQTVKVGDVGHNGMLLSRQVVDRIVAALSA
jgi:triacylglycerol lipase